jgi:hypothetical protein
MTTIVSRPQNFSLLDFAKFGAFIVTLIDVFAEAQADARAAHERYPFVD